MKARQSAVYLVSRVYPNTNGGTQHNIGTCNYLSNFLNMSMLSLLDHNYERNIAEKEFCNLNFNIKFYYTGKTRGYKERFCMLEPIDENFMNGVKQTIYDQSVSIVFFTLKMFPYVCRLRKEMKGLTFIYVSHNAEFMNIVSDVTQYDQINHVNPIRHAVKLIQAQAYSWMEGEAVRKCDYIFSISNNDSVILSKRYHVNRNKFILNKPMIQYAPRTSYDKWKKENYTNRLLIVGNMSWYPTVKGTRYFVEHIYSRLKKENRELQLFIVGAKPAKEIIDCTQTETSIVVTGFVESVKKYYEMCDIAIVPIYEGTGAKLKVLEALGNHIPVVMTDFVAKDYEGVEQVAMVTGDNEKMIKCIQQLIDDEQLRRNMCENEKAYYSQYMKENRYVDRFFEGC